MRRPVVIDRDYRRVVIPRRVSQEIESSEKPTRQELIARGRQRRQLVDRFLPERRASAILEIGCGFGELVSSLVESGYGNVKATELTPERCAFVEAQTGVRPVCADVFDFLAEDAGRYDVIIALDVIAHFNKNEIVGIVDRLFASLNPGGAFLMRVPNGSSLGGLSAQISSFTHETAFTPASIRELFRAVGFVSVECVPDPVDAGSPITGALKGALRWTFERVVSLSTMRMISADFAVSQGITGVGRKR